MLSGNNIASNCYGIILTQYSSSNIFYHNNIINNTWQVSSDGSPNTWDNGYPSGGNYWSDYKSTDLHSGPYQNETGSDGIGDTSYVIDSQNIDHYPLMTPFSARAPTVSVSPTSVTMDIGRSYLFNSTVSGGASLYSYQWYLNNASISGATNPTWTFTPTSQGFYNVYANVTNGFGITGKSNIATVTVNPALSTGISPFFCLYGCWSVSIVYVKRH